jgi:sugar lactone lactonase YvrE
MPLQPDLVIGQPSVNARAANYTGQVSALGVDFAVGLPVGIAFDSNGNLWTTDPGNRRVLEFPQSAIAAGGNAIAATVELGQPNLTSIFATTIGAGTPNGQTITNQFAVPLALGFDGTGNLFVSDADPSSPGSFSRVLVFVPAAGAFGTAASATRIMGVLQASQLTGLSASQLQATEDQTVIAYAQGLFFLADSSVGVVDSANNRILIFPPYSKWPAQSTSYSPQAGYVVGQSGFTGFSPNGVTSPTVLTPPANSGSLWSPSGAVYNPATNQLFVADTGNNRVLAFPLVSGSTFSNASGVLGQASMSGSAVNLIEGKEFDFLDFTSGHVYADTGIALDTTGSVPHLYVSDTYNNRVLAFYDARKIAPGAYATIVIGQKDFTTALCNYPTGDTALATQQSLCQPTVL